jgi:hypothetical protein
VQQGGLGHADEGLDEAATHERATYTARGLLLLERNAVSLRPGEKDADANAVSYQVLAIGAVGALTVAAWTQLRGLSAARCPQSVARSRAWSLPNGCR